MNIKQNCTKAEYACKKKKHLLRTWGGLGNRTTTPKETPSSLPQSAGTLPCFLCCHHDTEPPPLPLSDAACQDREGGEREITARE